MTAIRELILKDVRCFEGRQAFNIRPLTFLVGENSTGKSTALGCFQALSDFTSPRKLGEIDFNNEPYQMGAYADIARETQSLVKTFEIGFKFKEIAYKLILMERENGSEPVIQQTKTTFPDGEIIIKKTKRKNGTDILDYLHVKETANNKFIVSVNEDNYLHFFVLRNFHEIYYSIFQREDKKISKPQKNLHHYLEEKLKNKDMASSLRHYFSQIETVSLAPIRSKPQRTYDPLKEAPSSEGNDMPMVLMNLSTFNKKTWTRIKDQLESFGKASGLFTAIYIRKLGSSVGDPFQIQIKVRGSKSNLMDVGYGVSQILPILVRILHGQENTFLLQQPEVHLHPRGQAELTSFLIGMKESKKHSFVIETHSDYMIDRARIEIMKGKLKPDDVSLIYLEPVGDAVKIYNIEFDKQANMKGVPNTYRDFFSKEQDKLLGFGD